MENINAKYNAVLSLCKLIKGYLDDIHEYAETRQYDKNIDKIMKSNYGDSLFYKFARIKIMMEDIESLLADVSTIKIQGASDTLKSEFETDMSKLKVKLAAMNKEFLLIDIDDMKEIMAKIIEDIDKGSAESLIVEYRDFYHSHRGCINIYANLMQSLIDHYFQSNKTLVFKLIALVEDDKNMALKGITPSQFTSKSKKNPPQHRYGMLPITKSMPLKDLYEIIFAELNCKIPTGDFKAVASKLKIGLVVLNKIVYTPVEFNPRPLIIEEDATQYIQPNKYGINEKIIERFNTIIQLKNTDTWDFSIEIYNADADKFFVLETIDGVKYKALAPWLKSDKYSMARFRVARIINSNPVGRSVEYHSKKTEMAVSNMFTKKMLDLDTVDEKVYNVDSNDIRNSIVDDVMRTITGIREKEYKNGFKNSSDVINLLHDQSIIHTYINSSLIHYAKGADGYNGGDFDISEILSTFLVMLQETGRRFSRELHNGYVREPLDDSVFTDNKTKRDDIVMERVLSIVERALALIIKLDSNPFVHIYTKYLKMNFDM